LRAAFVYANPRRALAAAVEAGAAPDTGLLGQNHLAEHGIDARICDSLVRRGTRQPGLVHRVTWFARELVVPWEVGPADVIVTPLGTTLPLAARVRRRSRVVLMNVNFCTMLSRLEGIRREVFVRSLRAADTIVCFAAAQRTKLLAQADLDPERVKVVALGVDDRFYRREPEPAAPHVLAVGRDNGRDYRTFAKAIASIDAPATIVASRRNLDGIALPGNAKVEYDASPTRLRELYASATCVVVPTRSSEFTFGADCSGQTVLLDSMAMGRPTVISHRSTLEEYVDEGTTAMFVPPEDHDALASSIATLLDSPDLRDRLAQEGRAAVEDRFSTRQLGAALAPLLRKAP
jgi:glycosyltransferase involved in cell wall biosynthesis